MNKGFTPKPGRLIVHVREMLRFHHCACSTEKSYVHWILRYVLDDILYDLSKPEIKRFLNHPAVNRYVSAATQTLA